MTIPGTNSSTKRRRWPLFWLKCDQNAPCASDAERFPLGVPTNRPREETETPISGRPGWYKNQRGIPHYREPPWPARNSQSDGG